MSEQAKICGTCRWNSHDGRDFGCVNDASENCGDYTSYDHTCDEWEAK